MANLGKITKIPIIEITIAKNETYIFQPLNHFDIPYLLFLF